MSDRKRPRVRNVVIVSAGIACGAAVTWMLVTGRTTTNDSRLLLLLVGGCTAGAVAIFDREGVRRRHAKPVTFSDRQIVGICCISVAVILFAMAFVGGGLGAVVALMSVAFLFVGLIWACNKSVRQVLRRG